MNLRFSMLPGLLCGLFACQAGAQAISSRVIDAGTGEPVPYATVEFSPDQGVITNEEGRFSFIPGKGMSATDSIYVSCMGYDKTAFDVRGGVDSVIRINPRAIELSAVYLFDHELTAGEIIERVKENIPVNYRQVPLRQRLFIRHSSYNRLTKMDIEFKESTIEELNEHFIDSVVNILPKSASDYTETLCDYYRKPGDDRLYIVKAARLFDKSNRGSMDALSEKLEKIFVENVKPDSYLKIKSGIFGGKVEVDSILNEAGEAQKKGDNEVLQKNNDFLDNRKNQLHRLYGEQFYDEETKLNFLEKSSRYEFELKGYTTMDDIGVFVMDFKARGSQDFKGTLYINIADFAILRMDYINVKPLRRFHLLGLTYEENVYKGTTIFTRVTGEAYAVKFIEKIEGHLMGVDRPLKVIEKNKFVKGRRKQNELSLGIDVINQNTEKTELVVFASSPVTSGEINNIFENDTVRATYLSQYNPDFWKGYTIMEPNQAIREFKGLSEKGE